MDKVMEVTCKCSSNPCNFRGKCECCQACEAYSGFQKILDLKDAGLVIYSYTKLKDQIDKKTGNFQSSINTTDDVFIIHNTKDIQMNADHFVTEIDDEIYCPRCRELVQRAQKYLRNIPSIGKKDVISVCDHCQTRKRSNKYCCECHEALERFLVQKDKQSVRKEQIKAWLTKIPKLLSKNFATDKITKQKYRAHSELDLYKLHKDDLSCPRRLEVGPMLEVRVKIADSARSIDKIGTKSETVSKRLDSKRTKFKSGLVESRSFTDIERHVSSSLATYDTSLDKDIDTIKQDLEIDSLERLRQIRRRDIESAQKPTMKHRGSPFTLRKYYSDENIFFSVDGFQDLENRKRNFSYVFPKEESEEIRPLRRVKTSAELIEDTQDKLRLRAKLIRDEISRQLAKRSKVSSKQKQPLTKSDEQDIKTQISQEGEKSLARLSSEKDKIEDEEIKSDKDETRKERKIARKDIESPKGQTDQKKDQNVRADELQKERGKKDTEKKEELQKEKEKKKEKIQEERERKEKEKQFQQKLKDEQKKSKDEKLRDVDEKQKEKKEKENEKKEQMQKEKERIEKEKQLQQKLKDEQKKIKEEKLRDMDEKHKNKKEKENEKKEQMQKEKERMEKEKQFQQKLKDEQKKSKGEKLRDMDEKQKDKKEKENEKKEQMQKEKEIMEKEKQFQQKLKDEQKKIKDEKLRDMDEKHKDKKDKENERKDQMQKEKERMEKEKQLQQKLKDEQKKTKDEKFKNKDEKPLNVDDKAADNFRKERDELAKLKAEELKIKKQQEEEHKRMRMEAEKKAKEDAEGKSKTHKEIKVENQPDIGKSKHESKQEIKPKDEKIKKIDEKTQKEDNKIADNFRKMIDEQAKLKAEAQNIKKQQEEESKRMRIEAEKKIKEKELKDKEEAERKLKVLRETMVEKIPDNVKPKQETKQEEPTSKELDIKQIKIRKPSQDDLILQLVRIRQSTGKGERRRPKRLSEINITPLMVKEHRVHRDRKILNCAICADSELELDVDSIINNKNIPNEADLIVGNKIIKSKHPLSDKPPAEEMFPVLYKSLFTEDLVPKQEKQLAEKITDRTENMPPKLLSHKYAEQELPKGIIRYALSDRSFIDKGWTMLPTEKVVRKMNVYRMRPAHPEFDWFDRNKNKRLMLYDSGEKLAEFDDNGRGRWFYRNGRLALDYYDAEEINAQQRFVIYGSGEPDERGRYQPISILATFDYLGNGVVFDHTGKISKS
ncbi:uncharacterized protein [Epargyreus clarus]|uniref:uncharacterized protein isoform X2 n=1 Tax=Epargyreus clarus TaxID=520877 RepID=UPI003C2FEEFA